MCDLCDNTFFFSQKQRIQLNKVLDVNAIVEAAINQLYNDRKIDEATKNALFASQYLPLKEAVNEGFGVPPSASGEGQGVRFAYGTPNYEFLKQLQTNTAVFAAFKNHSAMKDMAALLKDADGNLRTRDQFRNEALKVDSTYRGSKLDVEYDTAVRSARMAANWQKYEKNKRLYPNLRYVKTKAAKPDKNHEMYVGIVRPVDDMFWNAHYPPNRWRCQCSVEQTDDEPNDIPENLPPVPPGFDFNSGKTGQVFDLKNSDYIKSVPPKQQPALIKMAEKYVNTQAAKDAPQQVMYSAKNGATVKAHPLAFDNNDFNICLKTARELANLNEGPKNTDILPCLADDALRKVLLPDAKNKKNPDYRIQDTYFDRKEPVGDKPGTRTFKNLLRDALEQADGAVLIVPDGYCDEKTLTKMVNRVYRHSDFADFKVWVKFENVWSLHTQQSWKEWYQRVHNE